MQTRTLHRRTSVLCLITACLVSVANSNAGPESLETGWTNPPVAARARAYWWWLNGNVTKGAITRDLEEMKAKGWGGALICDADGASQDGNDPVKHGPTFLTPEWRELYRHALGEADRLGLEMSLNIQSGWNLGGPMVTAEDAAKKLVWSEVQASGPTRFEQRLPEPKSRDGFYRDLFVVVFPRPIGVNTETRRPLQNWEHKAMHRALHFSAPDTSPLLTELPSASGEEDTRQGLVLDLTAHLESDGVFRWDVPAGDWQILRFGCTIGDHARVSTSSDGWKGYAIDVLDAGAFGRYWDAVVEPLIADAGSLAGRTLKYLHTDSWEVEAVNWTPTLREEFRRRRGYDLLPFLPVLAGRIVDDRSLSHRFLHDFRRTLGDLAIDNHYRLFRDGAHRHGLQIHPESGGPHAVPVDAQQCLGFNDVPMSEFWAWSWRHRVGESNRFFVKQPASAAHTYGRRFVAAEGFTTIGPHWQETIWDNLKPSFDRAACEGLNLLVWHAFVCSPEEEGRPGIQYFAGTHINPNSTWWPQSGPFISYLNRCQWMLQQGLFVADACYYYGDHVPNFAQLKRSDPARVLPGYDYDVVTEEVLLTRAGVRDGRIVLADGMSYRVLVLRDNAAISLPVLRKVQELVAAGATVLGPKPSKATGLAGFPNCDTEVRGIADALWGSEGRSNSGRVITEKTAREVLLGDGVKPDFEFRGADSLTTLDYVHRRVDDAEIYFVANRSNRWEDVHCTFRVSGKAPELWLPDSGAIRCVAAWDVVDGLTTVPLRFEPYGSFFVVFRNPSDGHRVVTVTHNGQPVTAVASALGLDADAARGSAPGVGADRASAFAIERVVELWNEDGPIRLCATEPGTYDIQDSDGRTKKLDVPALPAPLVLDREWVLHVPPRETLSSATRPVKLEALQSWTRFEDPLVKYHSGTLEYTRQFELSDDWLDASLRLFLELGDVRELAEVELNGQNLGIVWKPPFAVEVTGAARRGQNHLRVRVTNFWPNRIIGEHFLPEEQRYTRTNIRKLTRDTPLMESGLLGPVRLRAVGTAQVPRSSP